MTRLLMCGLAVLDFVFRLDRLPDAPVKHRAHDAEIVGGGGAANAAVAVARLGGDAVLASRVADDVIADLILADLRREGVDTGLVDRAAGGKSSYSSIYVDAEGERQIVNFRGTGLRDAPARLEGAGAIDAVLTDNRLPLVSEPALRLARARGIPGVVDGEDTIDLPALKAASHIAFSAQGVAALTGEADIVAALKSADAMLSGWVCVTDGGNGVYIRDGRTVERVPAFSVEVKDTLAAGDVWHGAFALRLAEGAGEIDAVHFANAAAALKCTRFGGRNGCPDRTETEAFLAERRRST